MLEITSIAADLMRIFAQRHYNSDRNDDTIAIELLKYLQTLAHAEKVPTPKLDQYLAGEYPPGLSRRSRANRNPDKQKICRKNVTNNAQ